jgi:hypothetical protein
MNSPFQSKIISIWNFATLIRQNSRQSCLLIAHEKRKGLENVSILNPFLIFHVSKWITLRNPSRGIRE